MGCATSKAATHQGPGPEHNQQPNTAYKKSGSTRARRLSFMPQADTGSVVTVVESSNTTDVQEPPFATSLSGSGSTRGRRLSYVTNDAALQAKFRAEYQQQFELEQAANQATIGTIDATATVVQSFNAAEKARQVNVQVACISRAGREPGYKKTNQDNCFAFEKFITEEQSMFGAMDGHGPQGHLVSGFVKQQLPMMLVGHLTSGMGVQQALSAGFLEVDRGLAASRIDCEFSGSTCSVAYLKGSTLTTAWVGDSRIVLGRQPRKGIWEAVELSKDHKPTQPEERNRILNNHGRVERLADEFGQPMGPFRVWLQYAWIPGLAMSRALGDQLAHTVGVSSEPQHIQMEVTPADKLMILASDGVWEFISSQEAVDLVGPCETPEEACRVLVDEAHKRWLSEEEGVVDDITAVVVRFVHAQQ